MKKRLIFAAMLLLAFGSVKAQDKPIPTPNGDSSKINTLVVSGTGSVWLKQGDKLTINDYGHHNAKYRVEDSVLYLEGTGARELTLQNLAYLKVLGTAGVRSKGQLKGENLSINKTGTGVLSLEVGYNNIYVRSCGTGDVILLGDCNVFCSEVKSLGKVNASNLNYMVLVEKSGDKWNMAINIDDELTDSKRNFLNGLVNNAVPFFEAESNRSWDSSFNVKAGYEPLDTLQLKELMRELGVNLQQLSDSVDWEKFEQDMEKWGADMEEWGRKMEKWGDRFEKKYGGNYEHHYDYQYNSPESRKDEPEKPESKGKRPEKKNLLFDANWNGFEAGLNMLFNMPVDAVNSNNGAQGMGLKPLRSWYFGFNIADVGIAFSKRHIVGLFTGVGLGWNNFSWNNDITIEYDPDNVVYTLVPIDPNKIVKNTKNGALFLQVPLMLEIRPTRKMYIDAGVTGGLRFAQWNRVKFADGTQLKHYHSASLNQFKLDASLRMGGKSMGFFANYALLPLFDMSNAKVHPVSFGFSINF